MARELLLKVHDHLSFNWCATQQTRAASPSPAARPRRSSRTACTPLDKQVTAAVGANMTHCHRREGLFLPLDDHDRPQSSSASRVTAGRFGVLSLHPLPRAT